MSNYPDDFTGTNMDAEKCVICGKHEYTNDDGICGECEWYQKRSMKEITKTIDQCNTTETKNARDEAYLHMLTSIGNYRAARVLGWI